MKEKFKAFLKKAKGWFAPVIKVFSVINKVIAITLYLAADLTVILLPLTAAVGLIVWGFVGLDLAINIALMGCCLQFMFLFFTWVGKAMGGNNA